MNYDSFMVEMLRDRDLTRLGNLEQTERTLKAYFKVVDGEKLSAAGMPLVRDAFWFAYETGSEAGANSLANSFVQLEKSRTI